MIQQLLAIKHAKGLSNESLAHEIGVKLITIHRWLNLLAKPSPMALKLITNYIKKNKSYLD